VARKRRMVRYLKPDAIPPGIVGRMLERARHAPSAGFTQRASRSGNPSSWGRAHCFCPGFQ
jgi:nitroreductase